MNIENIYQTGQVRRYHANPKMAPVGQTTADHSWGVAALILVLHPSASTALLTAAIFHDSGERWCGDLPHPFKKAYPDHAEAHRELERVTAEHNEVPQPDLTDEEKLWLKLGDRLESQLFTRLHRPDVWRSWGVQDDILELAARLGVSQQVQQMIGGQ